MKTRQTMLLFCCALASAQLIVPGLDPAASLSMVLPAGAARPAGMGGAFTAVADDPAAAAWNPAGLAQLTRPELSLSYDRFTLDSEGSAFSVTGTTTSGFSLHQTVESSSGGDYSHVGFASITFPFTVRSRNMTTQVTYRKRSTFPEVATHLAGRRSIIDPRGTILVEGPYASQSQLLPAGDLYDYSISVAGNVFGRLNLGVSANYLDSSSEITFSSTENGSSSSDRFTFEFSDLQLGLGFLLKLSETLSAAGVYHTEATWPSGYAVGLAFRPMERLILALDYSETNWTKAKILFDPQRDESSIRFGTEYVIVIAGQLRLPLRAGYFQQRRAVSLYGQPGLPPEYDGFTVGGGMGFDMVRIDFGYVRTHGDETGDAASGELFIAAPELNESRIPVEIPSRKAEVVTERLLFSFSVRF